HPSDCARSADVPAFLLSPHRPHRAPPSFPTRRSSDLVAPVAPVADDGLDDDEPPPADDYYDALAGYDYLEAADEPAAEPELPAAQPATGLAAEWLDIYPRLGLSGLTANIAANCSLVAAGDVWRLHLEPTQSALFNASQLRRMN